MAMELSVWSNYYHELSPEEALAEFKANGIFATELSDEHGLMLLSRSDDVRATGRMYGEYARELGMNISQGHLWLNCRLVSDPDAVENLKKWIDLYEAAGVKNMVLHMEGSHEKGVSSEDVISRNVEKLLLIAAHVKGRDVCICLENLCSTGTRHIDEILEVIRRLDSENFGVTLDTGHLNMEKTTSQREFILSAGRLLKAVHIADNEGETDQHMMPFGKGNVDFIEVISALREVGYDGILNYEIPGESRCPLPVRNMKLRYIRQIYDYIMSL